MKKIGVLAALSVIVAAYGSSVFASSDELLAHCEAFQDKNADESEREPADCACIAENAEGDVLDELLSLETPDDVNAASEEALALIEECTP